MDKKSALRALVAAFLGCGVAFGVLSQEELDADMRVIDALLTAVPVFLAAEHFDSRRQRS